MKKEKKAKKETAYVAPTLSEVFASQTPPSLPDLVPKLVKISISRTPDQLKPTVAQAIFPPLGAYPVGLRFEYIDGQEREPRINCLTIAPSSSGKDTCTRQPLNHIVADMKRRDAVNRERLRQFNEKFNRTSNAEERPKRPDDLMIQVIMDDITRAGLYTKMDDAQGAPLYVKLNELERWDQIEGARGRNNQFTVMKTADDEDNDFGSDRAGTQSVTTTGTLFLNWNANSTIAKAIKYFKYVLVEGPLSRITFATIPEMELDADIPRYGKYDKSYDEALKPYIENLKAATGTINCWQAKKLAERLKDECREFAVKSQSREFFEISHRAVVAAFRKACLLYVANGLKYEKSIDDFCRWSFTYDMWIKMTIWGDAIRDANKEVQTSKRGPRNLLEQIPANDEGVFCYKDAENVRTQNGMSTEGTSNMLAQWKCRGHILQLTDDTFKKVHYLTDSDKKA